MGRPEKATTLSLATSGDNARAKWDDLVGCIMADIGAAKIWNSCAFAPVLSYLNFIRPERPIVFRDVADPPEPDACCAAHVAAHHNRLHGAISAVKILAKVFKHNDAARKVRRPWKANKMG